ncbi:MAG TPA: DUF1592 domain-containing protein [Planctomycetota bacterium]|nr:DUF1592 domain-containing protein [Planctomycetota bacterium]
MIPRLLLPVLLLVPSAAPSAAPAAPDPDLGADYVERVRPLLAKYCLSCHSTEKKKGDLDLERFPGLAEIRRDLKPWPLVIENLENGEMPPKKATPLPAEERKQIVAWTREMIGVEARARAGDPGRVVVRRLSNAEYNNTIRDLSGVDLEPARDFPADGAAGEGFSNAGDALVLSPTLLQKYLAAAKEVAARVVLLPDGFRFSPSKNQRDWTDESLVALRTFLATVSADGKLPLKPYLTATIVHRDDLAAGRIDDVAAKLKLSPKYLGILWTALHDPTPSTPLDALRATWKTATAKDVDALVAEIGRWQTALWRTVKIGSYGGGKTLRQEAADPAFKTSQELRFGWKPVPGANDVTIALSSAEYSGAADAGQVVWKQPRFVTAKSPDLLLKNYAQYGPALELDLKSVYADTAEVLGAVAAGDPGKLDPAWVKRWSDFVALKATAVAGPRDLDPVAMVVAPPLTLLSVAAPPNPKTPSISGWHSAAGELPVVVSNASDKEEHIPGRANPHQVQVHPTPDKVAAIAWKSPVEGRIRIEARIQQVHGCGNGVAWWLEARRGDKGLPLAEGTVGVVQEKVVPPQEVNLRKGDMVVLAVDPRDNDHICDLTEVGFVLKDGSNTVWDLSHDVADSIRQGNPHADGHGNADVWQFCEAPLRRRNNAGTMVMKVPPVSRLDEWRQAPSPELAKKVQDLLTGPRPAAEKSPDRLLYDLLVAGDSPLLQGIAFSPLAKPQGPYGLDAGLFTGDDLILPAGRAVSFRIPAGLMKDHDFAVDAAPAAGADRVLQCSVSTAALPAGRPIDVKAPCIASADASKRFIGGLEAFRRVFPQVICFPHIVPEDEVVCLKLFHREDALLSQLFLDDARNAQLEKLWEEQKFISQWPVTEHKNLPLFIGFVTQDGGKEAVAYFESLREPFRKRAEAFEAGVKSREPAQIDALLRFAARAYRRPLTDAEFGKLNALYGALRAKEMSHLDALRGVMTRILVSPSFLFKLETAAAGHEAQPVSDAELATRLSYFLWASTPDAELMQAALHEPAVIEAQVRRLLKDPRARGIAVEFATQWLHVRAFLQNREKNEKLFPTFDDGLRAALFEEPVLLFMELFRNDRPARELLDADYTYLNERLAKHYGIPGIAGPQWRRVDGVRKYGRGGILTLGSVLAQESGASRTSPVLRGNWLVETLLGEKLPKPPANVPRLPEEEGAAEGTVREMVARHTRVPECAVCHVRIDPFGFAMEKYDPIGRFRDKDAGGRAVDVAVELKDGTRFEGLDGLRAYLFEKRRREVETTFCRKLLGYALGRSTTLSDQPLIDAMVDGLEKGGPLSGTVLSVAQSRQFRYHRGLEATKEE